MKNFRLSAFITRKAPLLLGALAATVLMAFSGPAKAIAAEDGQNSLGLYRVYGTVSHEGERLMLNNIQGDTNLDTLVLNISDETRILDALNGYPVSADSLKDGEMVYAYISPAMTLSLPPQSYAEMIICQIPAGFAAPSYETAAKLTGNSESGWQLTTNRGMVYGIDSETTVLPYLTRNIVTPEDLTSGTACLVWPDRNMTDASGNEIIHASKVVIFPGGGSANQDSSGPASDPGLTDTAAMR